MTFFEKYSYKQKNYALLIISVLLLAAVYKRALSVTFETREYRQELAVKLEQAITADVDIRSKQMELAQLNRYLGEEGITVEKVQQEFLNFFARNAKHVSVYQIDEVLNFKHPDFEINTHRIVLKGDYLNTLRFLYQMEKEFSQAKLLSISFDYERKSFEEDKSLFSTLLIQNFMR